MGGGGGEKDRPPIERDTTDGEGGRLVDDVVEEEGAFTNEIRTLSRENADEGEDESSLSSESELLVDFWLLLFNFAMEGHGFRSSAEIRNFWVEGGAATVTDVNLKVFVGLKRRARARRASIIKMEAAENRAMC